MSERFTAACIQMTTGAEPAANIAAATELIRRAHDAGAALIMSPETTDMMEARRVSALEKARTEADHAGVSSFRDLAAELGVWLLAGSFVIRHSPERLANRSFLFDPEGGIAARYDKIHMFDVEIPDGQSYRESRAYEPGRQAVVADLIARGFDEAKIAASGKGETEPLISPDNDESSRSLNRRVEIECGQGG